MLQNFREHIKGWVAFVIFTLIALTFVLWGVQFYFQERRAEGPVAAKVNGYKIMEHDVKSLARQYERNQRPPITKEVRDMIYSAALDRLVNERLGIEAFDQVGYVVSQKQVMAFTQQAQEFQKDGRFSPELFRQVLLSNGLTPASYYTRAKEQLSYQQIPASMRATAFLPPYEVQRRFELLSQQRSFGYFTLPLQSFVNQVVPTQAQIARYYKDNKAAFVQPMQVKVKYVVVSPTALEKQVKVSDDELHQAYQSARASFAIPKRWHVDRVVIPLPATVTTAPKLVAFQKAVTAAVALKPSMAELQKQYPGAKRVQQWISQTQVSGELQKELNGIGKLALSKPMRTKEGLNVFKLLNVTFPRTIRFDEVKGQLRKAAVHKQVAKELNAMTQQLAELAYTNPTTLTVAAKALGIPVQTSEWLAKDDEQGVGVFADKSLRSLVFSREILDGGNNSTPVTLKGGDTVVVRVAERRAQRQKSIAEVKDDIIKRLKKQVGARKAGIKAYRIQQALQQHSIQAVKQANALTWRQVERVRRESKGESPELLSAVFSMSEATSPVKVVSLKEGDLVIVKLLKVTQPKDAAVSPEMRKVILNEYGQEGVANLFQMYMMGFKGDAKIDMLAHGGAS